MAVRNMQQGLQISKTNSLLQKPLLEKINAMTVYEMNIFQTLCLCIFLKMETHRQFLNTFIRLNQLRNT